MSKSNVYYPEFPSVERLTKSFIPVVIQNDYITVNLDHYYQRALRMIAERGVELCKDCAPLYYITRGDGSFHLSYKRFFIDIDFPSRKMNGSSNLLKFAIQKPSEIYITDFAQYIKEFVCSRLAQAHINTKDKYALQGEFSRFCDDMVAACIRKENEVEFRLDQIKKISPKPILYE